MTITFKVNGVKHHVEDARAGEKLVDFLHDDLNLTGTKFCCGMGVCRACTVSLVKPPSTSAEPIISCSTALGFVDGGDITTVEGVSGKDGQLHPVQIAFLDNFAFQCGYCTPGFVMASKIFLDWLQTQNVLSEAQLDKAIEDAIGDHICRCTGYVRYFEALKETALEYVTISEAG